LFITSLYDCLILINLLFFYANESFLIVKVYYSTFGFSLSGMLFYTLHLRTNHTQTLVGQIGLPAAGFRA
jgi:hypothetical protein